MVIGVMMIMIMDHNDGNQDLDNHNDRKIKMHFNDLISGC